MSFDLLTVMPSILGIEEEVNTKLAKSLRTGIAYKKSMQTRGNTTIVGFARKDMYLFWKFSRDALLL